MTKVGRNDPCICGSGKKYKKCCLKDTYVSTGKEESIKKTLVQELLSLFRTEFTKEKFSEAVTYFWGDNEMTLPAEYDQMVEINIWEWIVHDWVDTDTEKSLIDLYIEKKRVIPFDHMTVLRKMKDSVLTILEVQDVFPEQGVLVKDMLLGDEYDVSEKVATRNLGKWDIFGARVIELDGQLILSGAIYPFVLRRKQEMLDNLHRIYELYHEDNPKEDMRTFLKQSGEVINHQWIDMIINPPKITLATTDGEIMVVAKSYFDLGDADKARVVLGKHKDFEPEDDGSYVWMGKRNKQGSATVFGWIRMTKGGLTLECNSRERLARGRKLIAKIIPEAKHRIDAFEDINKAIESRKPTTPAESSIPFEVQQEFYASYMENHCRKWLKDRIPALGDKTPRQAMGSKRGKEQLRELLKGFENMEEHNRRDGRPYYDVSWMWTELGLTRD